MTADSDALLSEHQFGFTLGVQQAQRPFEQFLRHGARVSRLRPHRVFPREGQGDGHFDPEGFGVVSGLAEGLEEGVVATGCCCDQKPDSCLATIEWEHVPLGNRIEILIPADR